MVRQVNLYEAKTNLSRLVEEAAKGEDVIIAKNGKAMARLTSADVTEKPKERQLGQWGKYLTAEERRDFGSEAWWKRWKEADAEILQDFERSLAEEGKDFESPWPTSSSTRIPSSGQRKPRKKSAKARSPRSKARKAGSS